MTIIEFSDYECPFCKRAEPTVEQVVAAYPDKVRLVYRHYPLPFHKAARPAAEAAACANAQGKFWEYHAKVWGAASLDEVVLKNGNVNMTIDQWDNWAAGPETEDEPYQLDCISANLGLTRA